MKNSVSLIFSLIRQQTEMEGGERRMGDGFYTTDTGRDS